MSRRRLVPTCFLFLLILLVAVLIYRYAGPHETIRPYWLVSGAYVTYEQAFSWNGHSETEYMMWNVTNIEKDAADLYLVSHGVSMTEGDFTTVEGEANWTIRIATREVLSCSDPRYIGKKWAFWIPTDVRAGSTVDIVYGVSTISGSESISVLGQQKDCWIIEYDWPTANMKRWYDKSSGICLKILVVLHQQGMIITTTEIAVSTNISLNG